jgi:hypothetical protein
MDVCFVRTYLFPGVLRGRPGTSTRNHPHEPTTSKPDRPLGNNAHQSIRLLRATSSGPPPSGPRRLRAEAVGSRSFRQPGLFASLQTIGSRATLRSWGFERGGERQLRLVTAGVVDEFDAVEESVLDEEQ